MKIVHKLSLILLFITPIVGCVNDDSDVEFISNADRDNVIDISTTRTEGNILGVNSGDIDANALPIMQYSSVKKTMQNNTRANDPFTEIREVETFESVVLPELQPHIWIGNIMTKSSNEEFSFTTEQFTSYNELKVAFGSNVNSGGLFWGSNTSTNGSEHTISKATGLYVKFYQTSFKAIMDYPHEQIASIPEDLMNDAVYINSITSVRTNKQSKKSFSVLSLSLEVQ